MAEKYINIDTLRLYLGRQCMLMPRMNLALLHFFQPSILLQLQLRSSLGHYLLNIYIFPCWTVPKSLNASQKTTDTVDKIDTRY